jgi:hypothetical protein
MKVAAFFVAIASAHLLPLAAPAETGFDIQAKFVPSPCSVQQDCVIRLLFTNSGPDTSVANRVSLNKYNGKVATGYATRVGGSGALVNLPPLAKGASVTLTFVDPKIKAGTYTYQPRYSSPLNDRNNANHRITRTVTY